MKTIIAAALVTLASTTAHADYINEYVHASIGVGVASYTGGPDLEWKNLGLPNKETKASPAWRVGVTYDALAPSHFVPGVRVNAAYLNLGYYGVTSEAAPDPDPYYKVHGGYYDPATKHCAGECRDVREFNGGGRMQVVALTIEPYWNIGNGFTVGVEAGPALFHVQWNETATNINDTTFWGQAGKVENFTAKPHWEVGALLGASVSRGPFTLRYNYVIAKQHNFAGSDGNGPSQYVPAGWRGAHVLTLNYSF